MTDIPETRYATRVATLLSAATDEWRKSDHGRLKWNAFSVGCTISTTERAVHPSCTNFLRVVRSAHRFFFFFFFLD
jgi:hypothetical protein